MLKELMLVCGENFHSNKPLRIVRMMLSDHRGMLEIRISNPAYGALQINVFCFIV